MELVWRKSEKCANNACIEVADQPDTFFVRDSKNPDGSVLTFSRPDWGLFIKTVQANKL